MEPAPTGEKYGAENCYCLTGCSKMEDFAELNQESLELPVRLYDELISQQFTLECLLPQHPCHQLCHRPPDDEADRRRSLIGRFKPNIQKYLAEEPLNTSYNSTISSIHQDAVRLAIESSSLKLLNSRPPLIATSEQTLPRKTRMILAQLCTGHCRVLGQCISRIDPTARNHCHVCGHSPQDTHQLFDWPMQPTTLAIESLSNEPTEKVKRLNLVIDETS